MSNRPKASFQNPAARIGTAAVGGLLVLVGIALLVLPGPGLVLVLAGLLVLAKVFPAADRYVRPVRRRAWDAAEQSVSSLPRLALSVLTGLALIALGIVWGAVPALPLGGWSTGSSLVLSGLLLLALLAFSYRRINHRRPSAAF